MGILDAPLARPVQPGPPAKFAPATGNYFNLTYHSGLGGTAVIVTGSEWATPVMFHRSFTLDRVGVEVTSGAGSSVMRLGLRADSGSNKPSTLITEWTAGATIDCSANAIKELTVSTAITAGVRYWLCYEVEGANCTCRVITPGWPPHYASQAESTNPAGRYGFEWTRSAGVMTSPWSGTTFGGGSLSIFGRTA